MKSLAFNSLVNIFYQSPAGNPGARRYAVNATSHDAAAEMAEGKLKKSLPGVRIQAGDCEQVG